MFKKWRGNYKASDDVNFEVEKGKLIGLLLLDEPFAAIDAKVRKELRSWLRELINQVGITSIFVTHDQDEAIEVADEIITNKGRIEQIGTPVEVTCEQ